MPSWNIHTAHAERLLREEGAARLGVRDVDAFLLGNLAPDIHVGYMVPKERLSRQLRYKFTHFAEPGHVPEPAYWEFFEQWGDAAGGPAGDVVLGTWVHLVADHTYNVRSNNFLYDNDIVPSDETRIRKQGDFDLFGRTLQATMAPRPTAGAIAQGAAFPQYAIEECDVIGACESIAEILRENSERQPTGEPVYSMLDTAFLTSAFEEAHAIMRAGLLAFAAGDPAWGERRDASATR